MSYRGSKSVGRRVTVVVASISESMSLDKEVDRQRNSNSG